MERSGKCAPWYEDVCHVPCTPLQNIIIEHVDLVCFIRWHTHTTHTRNYSYFIHDSASLFQRPPVQTKLPQLRFHPAFQIGCLSAGPWSHWEKHITTEPPSWLHHWSTVPHHIFLLKASSVQALMTAMKHLHKQFMIMSYNERYEHDNLVPLCLVPRAFHCSTPCSIHQSKVVLHDLENRIPWLHLHWNCASLLPTRKNTVSGFGWLDFNIDDHHDCRLLLIFVTFVL